MDGQQGAKPPIGKLAPLVGVENLGPAYRAMTFSTASYAEIGREAVGEAPGEDFRLLQSMPSARPDREANPRSRCENT